MARGEQLIRQWKLLQRLGKLHYGLTVNELAEELDISSRTVRRDLDVLQGAGFPIKAHTRAHGRKQWRMDPEFAHAVKRTLGLADLISIYIGQQVFGAIAGKQATPFVEEALEKVRALLGPKALNHFSGLSSLLYVKPQAVQDDNRLDIMFSLITACDNQKAVRIEYCPAWGKPFGCKVFPYGIVIFEGSSYLLALYPPKDEIHRYKVNRINSVKVLDEQFKKPQDFTPAAHLHDSTGIFQAKKKTGIKIMFSPPLAVYAAELLWHRNQKVRRKRDGSVLLEFLAGVTEDLKRRIESFGPYAEVLAPSELRTAIAAELKQAVKRYKK